MQGRLVVVWFVRLMAVFLFTAGSAWAQYTASVQGSVTDPSGAAVSQAKVTLENLVTRVSAVTTTDAEGGYRFLSLAPGPYKVSAVASGFSISENIHPGNESELNTTTLTLKVGAATESVVVTEETPLINTSETRNQLTLETRELSSLPLGGRNMLSLTTLAPGVSGLGLAGGPGVASGTPGSGVNNFSTETAVDVSANGQGTVANMWIIDGLDVTSSVRQGVLNLVPNPDVIQETNNQVNTYSSEYGHGSGLQVALTTKSGSDEFHGLASDYFNYQSMFAKYSLPGSDHTYSPFHSNNLSGTIGGPIIIPFTSEFFLLRCRSQRYAASRNSRLRFQTSSFPAGRRRTFRILSAQKS